MTDERSVRVLRLTVPLAGATVLAEVAYPLVRGFGGGASGGTAGDALTVATVTLFAATSVTHATVTRGRRTAAALLAVFGGGGLLAEAVGVATGVPFGTYSYADSLGPRLFGVPAVIPLAWVMMAWPAYLVAARLTGRAGRAPARVLVAAWALASWDLFLDPQMVAAGHWRWADPTPSLPGVPAVPLTNYAGWLVVAAGLMAAFAAALPTEPPGSHGAPGSHRHPAGDAVPYGLYLWTYASSLLAHLAFFGLPAAAAWGAIGMGAVAAPLALSLRRQATGRVRERTSW